MNSAPLNVRSRANADNTGRSTRYLYMWLLLALFFEYARPGSFVPGLNALKLNSLLPLSLFVFCLFAKDLRPYPQIAQDPLAKWIAAYFGLIALSVTHAEVTLYAYTVMTGALGYLLLTFMIVRVCTTAERVRGVYFILILAHLVLIAMNPALVLNPHQRNYVAGATFLGDGNDFSLSVCILIPMALELAFASKSRIARGMFWTLPILLVLVVISTQSRGGTLGLLAVGGYLWLRSRRKGLMLALGLVACLAVLAYAPEEYFGRMRSMTDYQDDGSAMGRITAWKAAIQMCLDNPVLGVGAGMFPVSFGTDYRPAEHMPWLTAHSMYFLVLGELSIPGIIILLALVFGGIRASRKLIAGDGLLDENDRALRLLNASMVGFAVAGGFLSVSYYPHIFVLTGLMIALRQSVLQSATATPGTAAEAGAKTFSRRGRVGRAMGPGARKSQSPRLVRSRRANTER